MQQTAAPLQRAVGRDAGGAATLEDMRPTAVLCLSLATAMPSAAQDNALTSAVDAFGERVGTEQAGLYTEGQVRGLDLNDSGAYRIGDAYFVRAAALNDPVLAGVGIRVGVNAVRLAYPAPSGVVNYRLREPAKTDELRLTAGWRDFGTRVLQGDGSLRRGRLSVAGGVIWRPLLRLSGGNVGDGRDAGAVGAWQTTPTQRIRAFATMYGRSYDGDYAVVPAGLSMPPHLRPLQQYSPSWARSKAVNSNVGVLYDARAGSTAIDVAVFRSVFDIHRTDYTLIAADADGVASATTFRNPRRAKRADSAEVRVSRQISGAGLAHLTTLSLRTGRMATDLTSNLSIPIGVFDLGRGVPSDGSESEWSGTRGRDRVNQTTASAGYGLAWKERIQVRAGIHRAHYDKRIRSVADVQTRGDTDTTLYNVSAVVSPTDGTAVFGSWVTGLEESGVAPTSALNRDDVLPPVKAEQAELGVRRTLTSRLTLIGALFQIEKPGVGFRVDRSFGVVGARRHRGMEGSIAGRLDRNTTLILGAVAFTSRVSGPLIDAGVVGSQAAGISHRSANGTIERRLGPRWVVDGAISHAGKRWADTANTFRAPAVTTTNLGARFAFTVSGRPAEVRALASNVSGTRGYWVGPSGLLLPIAPRTVRMALTTTWRRAPGPAADAPTGRR